MSYYDTPTKVLHKGMALTVVVQVGLSLFMQHPKPNVVRDPLALQLFDAHEWVGIAATLIVLAHVTYSLMCSGHASWRTLLPWLTSDGRSQLGKELGQVSSWFSKGLPHPDASHALASTIHGFGLLAVLMQGFTGVCIFLGMAEDGTVTEGVHDVMELHEGIGMFIIAYLLLHVAAAIWHQKQGHDVISRIK
ncbi:MAG: cytochrome b/b6 domain-containing protein [Mariprofundus sp.]|nr:cytochrome b/b6 domain-containing protein [Mariprofundus sp.]